MTATMPGHQFLPPGLPRLAVGSWRVDPARSHASFAARAAGENRRLKPTVRLPRERVAASRIESSSLSFNASGFST